MPTLMLSMNSIMKARQSASECLTLGLRDVERHWISPGTISC